MALPTVTMEARVVEDAELRYSQAGTPVSRVRVVATSRKKQGDEWVDDRHCWITVTAFKRLAENLAEVGTKGTLLTITGRLQTEEWEKDGQKRSTLAVLADTIGASLAFNTVTVQQAERKAAPAAAPADDDPWGPPAGSDEPPF